MRRKFLIVLAFVAILTTAFVSTCGAYHTDIGGTYFPVNGSRPGLESITFVGANFSSLPSTLSASFAFSPYFPKIDKDSYGSIQTEDIVYPGNDIKQYYEIYSGVEHGDSNYNQFATEINYYSTEESPAYIAYHYGVSAKTYGYRGNISDSMFTPEYSMALMYENMSQFDVENIEFRVRDVVTFSCYVENVAYSGSVTPTLESVTITADYFYDFDINSYYLESRFSASDYFEFPEVENLFSRAMTIDGVKPYFFSGHNISVTQRDKTTSNQITDLGNLSSFYNLRFVEHSAFSDELNQVSLSNILQELPTITNVVPVSNFWNFITSSLNSFLGLELAYGVTLGDILGIGISVSVLLILLKVFAGG